jgi:hypothetical protein
MALDFRTTTVVFDPTQGREQSEPGTVNFSSRVHKAQCALMGYNVKYDNGDHHILQLKTQIANVSINGTEVRFNVNFLLRDGSGNIDDPFEGQVNVLVIADVQ